MVVDVSAESEGVEPELIDEIKRAALWALAEESVADAELSIALVSDVTIARLNREYLAHEGPTDVISFPLDDPGDRVVGDIYIGIDQAARQAEDLGVTAREETVRLALHGLLHVLGWNHPEDGGREGSEMFRRQEELVGKWLDSSA